MAAFQTTDYISQTHGCIDTSSPAVDATQLHPEQCQPPQRMVIETANLDTIDLDAVQKINARMAPSNPKAPVCSNKNPLRLIQRGDRFITTQNIQDSSLHQIVEILANDALVEQSKDGPNVFCFHNRNSNRRILLRLHHASSKSKPNQQAEQSEKAYSETGSHSSFCPSQDGKPRRRGRRPGRKNKTAEEDDPDFEPDLPMEEVLPFPIIRKKTPAVTSSNAERVSKPPKYLIKDYKHLRLEDLKDNETGTIGSRNVIKAFSDDDSDVEYSESDGRVDIISDGVNGRNNRTASLGFDCDKCDKSFPTKAGLSRHKMLKHNPDGVTKRVGPWSDPVLSAIRRRKRLKEALEKATPEDISDIATPKVAQSVSLWDYLFLRTEATTSTLARNSERTLEPPELRHVLAEFMELVNRFQEFFNKHVVTAECSTQKRSSKELEIDEEEAVMSYGGPAPASVKRHRYLKMKKQKLAEVSDSSAVNGDLEFTAGADTPPCDSSTIEFPSRIEPPKCMENDDVIEIKSQLQATLLGVDVGQYSPILPFSKNYLPRRYTTAVQERPQTVSSSGEGFMHQLDFLTKRALVTSGEQIQPAQTIFENARHEEITVDPEPVLAPDLTNLEKSSVEQSFYLQPEGVGYPIPNDWIASGAFIPIPLESGAWSDLVVEAGSGRIFHRPTGQLVTTTTESEASGCTDGLVGAVDDKVINDSSHATAALSTSASIEPSQEPIFVTDISPTMCLITAPNGSRYHVEHGGEGVTTETLEAIIRLAETST